jgi:hypothetical protein
VSVRAVPEALLPPLSTARSLAAAVVLRLVSMATGRRIKQ